LNQVPSVIGWSGVRLDRVNPHRKCFELHVYPAHLPRGIDHVQVMDPVAAFVGAQMNGFKVQGPDALFFGPGFQLRVIRIDGQVGDFNARRLVGIGAEDHAVGRVRGKDLRIFWLDRAPVVNELYGRLRHSGAVNLPALSDGEALLARVREAQKRFVLAFALKHTRTDADDQFLSLGNGLLTLTRRAAFREAAQDGVKVRRGAAIARIVQGPA